MRSPARARPRRSWPASSCRGPASRTAGCARAATPRRMAPCSKQLELFAHPVLGDELRQPPRAKRRLGLRRPRRPRRPRRAPARRPDHDCPSSSPLPAISTRPPARRAVALPPARRARRLAGGHRARPRSWIARLSSTGTAGRRLPSSSAGTAPTAWSAWPAPSSPARPAPARTWSCQAIPATRRAARRPCRRRSGRSGRAAPGSAARRPSCRCRAPG